MMAEGNEVERGGARTEAAVAATRPDGEAPPLRFKHRLSADPWEHRGEHMRCVTCMWYCPKQSDRPQPLIGRCRRRAPTMNGYPAVFPTDWCGDHKVDETKL